MLLEAAALGWPLPSSCADQRESLALARELGARGLVAIIPVQGSENCDYPWTVFDTEDRCGLVIVRTVDDLPPWMIHAPFTMLLHFALASCGWRLVHAASLGLNGRGALIVGPGGAGKSATTMTGVLHGLSTVGDDYLALEFGDPPRAWPVSRVIKQAPAGLARLAAMRGTADGMALNWQGKAELDVDLVRAGGLTSSLDIVAILIPRRHEGHETVIEPAPPAAAFSALAPSTFSQLPGEAPAGFSRMVRLTRRLPAYWLHLSSDADEVGARLGAFLAGLAS